MKIFDIDMDFNIYDKLPDDRIKSYMKEWLSNIVEEPEISWDKFNIRTPGKYKIRLTVEKVEWVE